MDRQHQGEPATPAYRSGAVARLTGIPVETLRVWERRYKVVGPRQSATGQRQYSPDEVTRLTVIKRLVDAGYAIGSIAALDLEQLRFMLQQAAHPPLETLRHAQASVAEPMSAIRVAIVGEALAIRLKRQPVPTLHVVATSQNVVRAHDDLRGVRADTLLIEQPTLQRETPQTLRSLAQMLGAQRIVVEYGFASRQLEQDVRAVGCQLVRAPLNLDELESLCGVGQSGQATGSTPPLAQILTPPPRRFSSKALAEIASVSVALNCECPHHIAELLVALGNFETYSGECENRSPADAKLHQYLKQVTGNARAMMEIALQRVVEAEGIAVSKTEE